MQYEVKQQDKFRFVEEGDGEPLLLLHGLFGALSNFGDLIEYFRHHNKVIVPLLPLFDLDILHTSVGGLAKFVNKFIDARGYTDIHLLGNSLGGHVALVHVLKNPEKIKSVILTGSSGLFESGMGDTYPKRGDYEYIKNKTELTFYDPKTATKELVDEVYGIVNNRIKAIKNDFIDNGWAVKLEASTQDGTFTANNFIGNTFDVSSNNSESTNIFARNYWDNYRGYDLNAMDLAMSRFVRCGSSPW